MFTDVMAPETTKMQEADAMAEIFVMAFRTLPRRVQVTILKRLQEPPSGIQLAPQPPGTLRSLAGLVAWGGDAVEDSERYYDDL
jgi:hypothetical protein